MYISYLLFSYELASIVYFQGKLILKERDLTGISATEAHSTPPTVKSGARGRPSYQVERSQIEFLRDHRFSWTSIHRMLGIYPIFIHSVHNYFIFHILRQISVRFQSISPLNNIIQWLVVLCINSTYSTDVASQDVFISNVHMYFNVRACSTIVVPL